MERDASIARIAEARSLIRSVIADCAIPQIETMLRNADLELHLALWNLGTNAGLRAEPDASERAA